MTAYTLRPYQVRAIERVREKIRAGHKRVLLVSPTGSGKTIISCSMIESAIAKSSRAIFLTHRGEILNQTAKKLDDAGIKFGVIKASDPRWAPWASVQLCSIPTLFRRLKNLPPADLVFVDEGHHSLTESWLAVLSAYPDAVVVGLTATPHRNDGLGLGRVYHDIVVVAQPQELVDLGFLVPVKMYCPDKPNLAKVKIVAGDYDVSELEHRLNTKRLVGNVVAHWQRLAPGAKTIVFGVTIKHSQALRDRFIEAGVHAEHIDGMLPQDERAAILARLKSGETTVVTCCQVLTEGFDEPSVSCISLARPTKSHGLFIQMAGRALRQYPGKTHAIVCDHADAVRKHGSPLDDQEWTLADIEKPERGSKPEPDRATVCRSCFAAIPMGSKICPECGAAMGQNMPTPEETEHLLTEWSGVAPACPQCQSTRLRPIQTAAMGELKALIVCEDCGHRQFATSVKAKTADHEAKQGEYDRLERIRIAKGYKAGWSKWKYRAMFGVWPRGIKQQVENDDHAGE